MRFTQVFFGLLTALVLLQGTALAQLSKRQLKLIRNLAKPGSSMQVTVLDGNNPIHSIALIGVDYQKIQRNELAALTPVLERFPKVFIQKSDLDSPIRAKVGARAADPGVAILGDLPANWFRSCIYPCSTALAATGTAISASMLCLYPDLHSACLTLGAAALTYLNYKKWSTQEARYLALKLKIFARVLSETNENALLITDTMIAKSVGDALLSTELYSKTDLHLEMVDPSETEQNAKIEPTLTPEEIEKEEARLRDEDERERLQIEKHIEALRKEAEDRAVRDSEEDKRQEKARIDAEWKKADQRRIREEERAGRKAPKKK